MQEISNLMKDSFNHRATCIAHWEGKLLLNLIGKELVDRFPVLLFGLDTLQLFGMPKPVSGRGEAQATALVNCWKIGD